MHLNVSTILHIDFIAIRESAVVKYLNIPVFLYLCLEYLSRGVFRRAMGAQPPSSGLESMDFRTKKFKPYPGKIPDYAPGSQNYKINRD